MAKMNKNVKEFIEAVLLAAAVFFVAPLATGFLPEALQIALGKIEITLLLVAGLTIIGAKMLLAKVKFFQ